MTKKFWLSVFKTHCREEAIERLNESLAKDPAEKARARMRANVAGKIKDAAGKKVGSDIPGY